MLRVGRRKQTATFFASTVVLVANDFDQVEEDLRPFFIPQIIDAFFEGDPTLTVRLKELPEDEFGQVQVCVGGMPTPLLPLCSVNFTENLALVLAGIELLVVEAECADGHDNDNDGDVDFGQDPDCTALNDDDERN